MVDLEKKPVQVAGVQPMFGYDGVPEQQELPSLSILVRSVVFNVFTTLQ